ncbi:Histidine phosphatase superfamily (branch 1) [Brevibacterium siliguriense]|uniref:Histidine phosphatase superfamily (Branch 1) n=1 Tax=Brevibacterium siliguriense TaxID=1136497 RepID=A0A1H1U7V5_9MICO|nr:histidine phosphatase family protein [Brevibacterium siliguriense]SDS68447.1 Histidine phosphatase superfamily (branch 1) [Brevibacterium siliguriense]
MPVIVLLRHGLSSANVSGILAGRAPGVSLTDEGARALRANLELLPHRRFAHLLHSPLQRCEETATIAAETADFERVCVDEAVIELDYGAWTGRSLEELGQEPLWETVVKTASQARFPGGESITEASDRSTARVRELVAQLREEERADGENKVAAGTGTGDGKPAPPRWAMIVSHGDIIKAIIADALGMPLDDFQRLSVAPGSFTVIDFSGDRPVLAAMSVTAAGLAQSAAVGGGGTR